MPKYVDIEALQKALYDEDAITFRGLALISRFPVADVVPVVRCKDCKHNGTWQCHMEYDEYHPEADIHHDMHGDDDFCSYGERKDGAE